MIVVTRLQLHQTRQQSTRHSFPGVLCPLSSAYYSPRHSRVSPAVLYQLRINNIVLLLQPQEICSKVRAVFCVVMILMLRLYMFGNTTTISLSPDNSNHATLLVAALEF